MLTDRFVSPLSVAPVRRLLGVCLVAGAAGSGCASAPAAVKGPVTTFEQKMAWMLQLEDRRILRIENPAPASPLPARRGRTPPPPPVVTPDLAALVADAEPRVRRRAAIAMGRVGLRGGVTVLNAALADTDPQVREMAAFALGLIGDAAAAPALTAALADAAPVVRGRAAEALGLIGSRDGAEAVGRAAAEPIGRMAAEYARSAAVRALPADDETWPAAPEAEAFRLGIYALTRLRAYEPLAAAVIEGERPVTAWWPVAYALSRIDEPRAQPHLRQLLGSPGKYAAAFAARGLGVTKDRSAVPALIALATGSTAAAEVRVSAVRALGEIGDSAAAEPLAALASGAGVDDNLRLEIVKALGLVKGPEGLPVVQDLMSDRWPAMRAAALRAAAAIDAESFVLVLASMDPDPQWSVRAALAEVLGTMPAGVVLERVQSMLRDEDRRVIPAVLAALARLKEPDYAVRAAAARIVGELKPAGGADALRAAYALALGDAAADARGAMLAALAGYGPEEASATLKAALTDVDWSLRLQAAQMLTKLDPSGEYRQAIRPVPGDPVIPYADPQLIAPPVSPHVFIETAKGTIELELAVLEAPQTSRNFMALATRGFFNGLQIHRVVPNFVVQGGDPRGDGGGGPGYSIRDELNERPFVRGAVGMALSGPDTGGSQFFITHSPQPHLDAKYTLFGRVVNGMEVVDAIRQGDVIQRVRVWDGETMR